jgi:ADP-heptose:LPS heptosyltransferase
MQFLVANQDTTARIYGHTYYLRSYHNPLAGWQDILATDEASASELLRRHKAILSSASFRPNDLDHLPVSLPPLDAIKNGSTILLLRSGGIGDHIMLLPALKALRNALQHRSISIHLAVQEDMFPIFQENIDIDTLRPLPLPVSELLDADYVVDFSGPLKEALNPDLHLTDYFIRTLRLDPDKIRVERSIVSSRLSRSLSIIELFRRLREANPNHAIIFLNWRASTHIKSLPPSLFSEITKKLKNTIFLVGHPESLSRQTDEALSEHGVHAINISSHMKNLYDYFTAVSLSDTLISSDTSTYHIASLYEKPSLVITGPTYSVLTKYYPNCTALAARYAGSHCSSPCGRVRGVCPEAQRLKTPFSPCLMSISPEGVAEAFNHCIEHSPKNPH